MLTRIYDKLTAYPRPYYIAGAIVWAAVILVILLLPSSSVPRLRIPHADKAVHAGLFFILAWFIWHALRSAQQAASARNTVVTVLLAAAYGAFTEYIQLSAATRTADIFDAAADTLGAVILVLVIRWRTKRPAATRGGS